MSITVVPGSPATILAPGTLDAGNYTYEWLDFWNAVLGPGESGTINWPGESDVLTSATSGSGGSSLAPEPTPSGGSPFDDLLQQPRNSGPGELTELEKLLQKVRPTEFEKLLQKPVRNSYEQTAAVAAEKLLGESALQEVLVTASRAAGPVALLTMLPDYLRLGELLDDNATTNALRRLLAGDGSTGGDANPPGSSAAPSGDDLQTDMPTVVVSDRAPPKSPPPDPGITFGDVGSPGLGDVPFQAPLSSGNAPREPAIPTDLFPTPDLVDLGSQPNAKPAPNPVLQPDVLQLPDPGVLVQPSPQPSRNPKPAPSPTLDYFQPVGAPSTSPRGSGHPAPAPAPSTGLVCSCHAPKPPGEKHRKKKHEEEADLGEIELQIKAPKSWGKRTRVNKRIRLKFEGKTEKVVLRPKAFRNVKHPGKKLAKKVSGKLIDALFKSVGALSKF